MEQKPPVCRRLLFNEEISDDDAHSDGQFINSLQEQRQIDLQAATAKWNFDFQNDVPLEGDWKWEPVLQAEPEEQIENDQGA
jgi:hypothetical protein